MKELLKEIKEHSQLILNFMWYYNILFYLLITHTLHLMKHEATVPFLILVHASSRMPLLFY